MKTKADSAALIAEHKATRGITKCPTHAPATGSIRFNFATRAYKAAHPEMFRD